MSDELYNRMAVAGSSQDDIDTEVTSSDFTDTPIKHRLTDTGDTDVKQKHVTKSDDEENLICKNLRKKIFEILKDTYGNTPLNILVVGMKGEGKSCFGTSLRAAITGKWNPLATYGHYGGKDQHMTSVFRKYAKLWLENTEEFKDIPIPNFFDTQGLPDKYDVSMIEVVRALVEGRIPLDQSLLSVYQLGIEEGVNAIKQIYKDIDETRKINRILFVTACGQTIPERLINAVVAAVHPDALATDVVKYEIPLFVVRTKMDLMSKEDEKEERKRQEKLQELTGLVGNAFRFCKCTNYCAEATPDMLNNPEYDKIFLEFLQVLVDPNIVVLPVNVPLHQQRNVETPRVQDRATAAFPREQYIIYFIFAAIAVLFLAVFIALYK